MLRNLPPLNPTHIPLEHEILEMNGKASSATVILAVGDSLYIGFLFLFTFFLHFISSCTLLQEGWDTSAVSRLQLSTRSVNTATWTPVTTVQLDLSTDWLTNYPTNKLTNQLTHWLAVELTTYLADWRTTYLTKKTSNQPTGYLTDCILHVFIWRYQKYMCNTSLIRQVLPLHQHDSLTLK